MMGWIGNFVLMIWLWSFTGIERVCVDEIVLICLRLNSTLFSCMCVVNLRPVSPYAFESVVSPSSSQSAYGQ